MSNMNGSEHEPKNQKHTMKRPLGYALAGIVAAVASVAMYLGIQAGYERWIAGRNTTTVLDNPISAEAKAPAPSNGTGLNELKKTSESFRSIAAKVGPAVVNIKSTKGAKKQPPRGGKMPPGRGRRPQEEDERGGPQGGGDPFFDFFEQFRGGQPFPYPQQEMPQTSLGSGVIIDKKGIVVTNNHVVEDASEILVTLAGEKTDLKAKILGTDPKTDLAVLKIESNRDFPTAEWANSDQAEVGDWAIAIGSPFALGQSVTVGIISAKGRNSATVMGADFGNDLIQTDAAINPGNSGGPLCDIEGRVVGINTAIYTRSGGYMGIGFAIPSNLGKDVVGKLLKDGKIIRGWLGVLIQPMDAELAKELGIKEGVGIHEVLEGSPAADAGLKAGDVVTEVDGKAVKEVTELQRLISGYKPGQTVKIKVVGYSDKKSRTVTVKIGELQDQKAGAPRGDNGGKQDEPDKLGLMVAPAKAKDGVVVDYVQPGSIADQSGIEVGDIITRINRQPVNSVAAYEKLVKSSKRFGVELKRKGRSLFYQFVLPE